MTPDSPRNSLLAHSDKFRSQAASWLIGWIASMLALSLLAPGSTPTETMPSAYLQGCSSHCTSHMPLVCQNQWSCQLFCTSGYFQSGGISVETRANGEQFLARNDGPSCQPRCEKIRGAVCQGRVSCEKMCTFLYHGAAEPAPKESQSTWVATMFVELTVLLLDVFYLADLVCSWLRLRSSYGFIRAQHDFELPRLPIDTKTYQCGMVIVVRSALEYRAMFGSGAFNATILFLLLVDEVLQHDTQGLKAPQGVYVVSLLGRFLRAIVGRYSASSSEYSVPFATPVSTAAVPHATRSGHVGVGTAPMTVPVSTEPMKCPQAHPSSKVE